LDFKELKNKLKFKIQLSKLIFLDVKFFKKIRIGKSIFTKTKIYQYINTLRK